MEPHRVGHAGQHWPRVGLYPRVSCDESSFSPRVISLRNLSVLFPSKLLRSEKWCTGPVTFRERRSVRLKTIAVSLRPCFRLRSRPIGAILACSALQIPTGSLRETMVPTAHNLRWYQTIFRDPTPRRSALLQHVAPQGLAVMLYALVGAESNCADVWQPTGPKQSDALFQQHQNSKAHPFPSIAPPARKKKRSTIRCTRVPLIGSIAVRVVDSVSVDNKGGKEGGSGSQAISSRLVRMFGEEALVSGETESPGKDQKAVAAERWARGWRGNPLLLFPEGTTSNGSCLLRFKTGVFAGGLPVHPVTVQYDSQRFSPAFESIYAWVHIFRMLAEPAHHLRVEYLPRYCPTPEQRADRALYAKAVQGVFCKAMGLPAVDTGYAEKTTYHKYLRKSFQTHPWGAAAVLLPAPDLHSALLAKAPGHSCNERTSWVQKEGPNSDGSGGGMVEGGENDIVTAASSTERSIDSAVGVAGTGGSADKGEGRLRRRNGERAVH